MDHRQAVIAWARETLGSRMDEVLRAVRQDCEVIRAGEEPDHLRGVLRRRFGKIGSAEAGETDVSVAEQDFGYGTGEPDSTQQRDELGRMFTFAGAALEKLLGSPSPDLTKEEIVGLECCLVVYGRPAFFVSEGRLAMVSSVWSRLEDERESIELAQRGVGRIELLGHPEYTWCGSGFLVGETTLMTTRRIAQMFAERRDDGRWEFRPGVTAWMDNRSHALHPISAGCRVEGILGVDEHYDLALLRVERPPQTARAPIPLTVAAHAPQHLEGRSVYMIGYPVRDSRQSEPSVVARLFRDIYDVKRVHPGRILEEFQFGDVHLFRHDCGMLGNTGGACILDMETHEVLGLQVANRYLDKGTAIPLWRLHDCAWMRNNGVAFAEVSPAELESLRGEVEQIARTPYWAKLRTVVKDILQQALRE